MKRKTKHTLYYKLEDEMNLPNCPICSLIEKSTKMYIENLFYENVNDFEINELILASNGFCSKHTQLILQTKQSVGIAIIFKRIIDNLIRNNFSKGIKKCIICENENLAQKRYCETFVEYLDDGILKAYEGLSVLCMKHFDLITKMIKKAEVKRKLFELQKLKLNKLSLELEEYIRKFDYRFSNEKSGREKDSWIRAGKIIGNV